MAEIDAPAFEAPVSKAAPEKSPKPQRPRRNEEVADGEMDVEGFRQRMLAVSAILESTFGHQASLEPELWRKGAYLALIGTVVTTLIQRRDDLSTTELVNLARVLEQGRVRRASSNSRNGKNGEHGETPTSGDEGVVARPLPPYFGDVVRQIYGANLERSTDAEAKAEEKPVETG